MTGIEVRSARRGVERKGKHDLPLCGTFPSVAPSPPWHPPPQTTPRLAGIRGPLKPLSGSGYLDTKFPWL